MKYFASLIIVVFFGVQASAQFKQGTILVGGSVTGSFDTYKTDYGTTVTKTGTDRSFDFMPQAGYFVVTNFAVGLGLDLHTDKYHELSGDGHEKTKSSSFAPFARYYYKNFFGQGIYQFGAGSTRYDQNFDSSDQTFTTSGWKLGVGYAWLLNNHVAVEPLIGYSHIGTHYNHSTDKDIAEGLYMQIGFQVYLNR